MANTYNESYPYILPSGALIEIENLQGQKVGPSDVAKVMPGEKLPLDQVIGPLGEVANLLFENIRSSVKTPSSITLELGASLKGQTNLVIVSGEGTANIKVTLTWKIQD